MATTWNANRTKQNFQTRTRQWSPVCVSRRSNSSSSVFFRVAFLLLMAFPVIAKAAEQDMTSKGHDEGPLARGSDEGVLMDDGADSRGYFDGVPSDGDDPIQILRNLVESGDKDIGGRTKTDSKRSWSNNEHLRVWGKRNALRKHSKLDSARDSSQREMRQNAGQPEKDDVLVLLELRRPDIRGRMSLAQLEEVARTSGAGFQVFDAPNFGPQILGTAAGIPRPDEAKPKRNWGNNLRIWGKRGETVPADSVSIKDMYNNMHRRKWENLPFRVWGK